ncbi:hypothetical protein L1887_31843 [Cichorium endivia]|nr:hypothetical protein L1887_31843 [Cichorium endivia]
MVTFFTYIIKKQVQAFSLKGDSGQTEVVLWFCIREELRDLPLFSYHHHNAHISTATPSLNQPNLRLHGLPLPLLPPPDHHRHNNITRASITVVLASKK